MPASYALDQGPATRAQEAAGGLWMYVEMLDRRAVNSKNRTETEQRRTTSQEDAMFERSDINAASRRSEVGRKAQDTEEKTETQYIRSNIYPKNCPSSLGHQCSRHPHRPRQLSCSKPSSRHSPHAQPRFDRQRCFEIVQP